MILVRINLQNSRSLHSLLHWHIMLSKSDSYVIEKRCGPELDFV